MDLGIVDRITADAVGEPGMRTFYLQARAGEELITVIVEKEQVELLARSVLELLADIADRDRRRRARRRRLRSRTPSTRAGGQVASRSATTGSRTGSCSRSTSSCPSSRTRTRTTRDRCSIERARVDLAVGEPGADARPRPARRRGRGARPAALSVLRQPDGSGGPRMSGHERAPQAPDLIVPAALADGELEVLGALPELLQRRAARALPRRRGAPGRGLQADARRDPAVGLPRRHAASPRGRRVRAGPRAGWPRIPPTVLRDGPYGPGSRPAVRAASTPSTISSRSRWNTRTCSAASPCSTSRPTTPIARAGTACSMPTADVWMIDHGVCFAVEPKLRTVIWTFIDEPIADRCRRRPRACAWRVARRRRRCLDARCAARPRRGRGRTRPHRPPAGGRPLPRARARASARTHGRRSDAAPPDGDHAAGPLLGRRVAARRGRDDGRGRRGAARSAGARPRCRRASHARCCPACGRP